MKINLIYNNRLIISLAYVGSSFKVGDHFRFESKIYRIESVFFDIENSSFSQADIFCQLVSGYTKPKFNET